MILLWAVEMGRTPRTASPEINEQSGRDHHANGYSNFSEVIDKQDFYDLLTYWLS